MRTPKRDQPALDGLLPVLDAGRRSQALGRNGAHGRERILDAMMQFFENELLQLVRGFTLLGVDTGLREQGLGVDAGLFQQQPKAVILGRQDFLRGGAGSVLAGFVLASASAASGMASSGTIFSAPAAHHILQFGDHLLHLQRLAEEAAVRWLVRIGNLIWPDTRMILMEGQRSCTAWASFNPSMLPGIWMSENSSEMSERDSRMESASSALTASNSREPGILDDVDGAHAQHHLVFHDKDVRWRTPDLMTWTPDTFLEGTTRSAPPIVLGFSACGIQERRLRI